MGFRTLSSREKKILYITIIFMAIVLLYIFVISPVVNKWSNFQSKIGEKKIAIKKSLQVLDRANWLKKWHQSFPFNLDATEMKQDSVTKILSYIENLSKKSNLKIINISPGDIKEYEGYKFILIELTFEGKMKEIIDFLYNIESSAMMFRVDRLQVDSTPEEDKGLRVSLEIGKLMVL